MEQEDLKKLIDEQKKFRNLGIKRLEKMEEEYKDFSIKYFVELFKEINGINKRIIYLSGFLKQEKEKGE